MTPIRFLLVEDDASHARLVELVLREHRVANAIDVAPDAETALQMLYDEGSHEGTRRPDVILLDLRLPGMDGLAFLEIVKADEQLCSIPVIVLTSDDAPEARVRAYAQHANSFLRKPVDFERFIEMVRELGLYWTLWSRPPHLSGRADSGDGPSPATSSQNTSSQDTPNDCETPPHERGEASGTDRASRRGTQRSDRDASRHSP
ncbi:MAG: response regulator [Phycisphaerales bacterium]|nr:MAG: response regulator [Phycisphaerales bacterium]